MNSFESVKQQPADIGLARIIPEGVVGKVLFWALLPTALLLLTLGIAFVNPCSWTNYLPFIALGSLAASIRWRVSGLIGSYVVLIGLLFAFSNTIPHEMKLWQMGVLFTLALDFLIALLATQEVESKLDRVTDQAHNHLTQLHQSELKLIQLEHSQAEEIEKFEEEIKRLKEEAEQRRIEKHQSGKRLDCLESEIEMLTAQKEELISDTFAARTLANEKVHELERLKKQVGVTQDQGVDQGVAQGVDEGVKDREIEDLTQRLEKARSLYRANVQELETLHRQIEEMKIQTFPQEDGEGFVEIKRQLSHSEGLYKQLRQQFEEKSRILSQTRKELFQMQGKYLALEQQNRLDELDADRSLEKEVVVLGRLIEELEVEVTHLEELVSHTHSQ